MQGEVETEGHVLVIKRIHVRLVLRTTADQRETAERVHAMFADHCPLYRTLKGSIQITTELAYAPLA